MSRLTLGLKSDKNLVALGKAQEHEHTGHRRCVNEFGGGFA